MIRQAVLDALAVLLPVQCAGCGLDDRTLCDSCRDALVPEVSSRQVGDDLRVWSGLEYDGVTRSVVLALKRDGRVDAARFLAPALAVAVSAAMSAAGGGAGEVDVVAVPGTRAAFRRRGYDPVGSVAARAGLAAPRVFAPARPHLAQKLLDAGARETNLRGAFRVRRAVAGRRILIVDDVVTSGATLREVARTLRSAGAEVVGAAVVASTPRLFAVSQLPFRDIWG